MGMSKDTVLLKHITFGPHCLKNHSDVLASDASHIVFWTPSLPIILAITSDHSDSACWHISSASIIIISNPASKHLWALRINRSTSSTKCRHKRNREFGHSNQILLQTMDHSWCLAAVKKGDLQPCYPNWSNLGFHMAIALWKWFNIWNSGSSTPNRCSDQNNEYR